MCKCVHRLCTIICILLLFFKQRLLLSLETEIYQAPRAYAQVCLKDINFLQDIKSIFSVSIMQFSL